MIKRIHSDSRRSIDLIEDILKDDREVTLIRLKAGKAIGACVHQDREYMCLISGEIFCTIGCVREFLITGDARTIPPKKPHMFVAKTDSIIMEWGCKFSDKGKHDEKMRKEVDEINES